MADIQRKRATLDRLKGKQARQKTVTVDLPIDDEGSVEQVEILFRSIGATEYDKLVTQFPPNPAQKKEGAVYNIDRFAPALLSATVVDPAMSVEDATDLWNSESWNRGELFTLFREAVEICISGVPVDPTESASA